MKFSCLATRGRNSDLVTKKVCGEVTYGALPKDAVLRAKYLEAVEDKWTDTLPVPACRSATLILYQWEQPRKPNKKRPGPNGDTCNPCDSGNRRQRPELRAYREVAPCRIGRNSSLLRR